MRNICLAVALAGSLCACSSLGTQDIAAGGQNAVSDVQNVAKSGVAVVSDVTGAVLGILTPVKTLLALVSL